MIRAGDRHPHAPSRHGGRPPDAGGLVAGIADQCVPLCTVAGDRTGVWAQPAANEDEMAEVILA